MFASAQQTTKSGYQGRIVQGLLKLAQPAFDVLAIQLASLTQDDACRVLQVPSPGRDELQSMSPRARKR